MAALSKYALKKEIDELNNNLLLGLKVKSDGKNNTCVLFNNSNLNLTSSDVPCVLVQQVSDITIANTRTGFDILVICIVYSLSVENINIELVFEKLKKAFIKKIYSEYQYDSEKFINFFEYVDGSDLYNQPLYMGGKLMFNFHQFSVSTPKINY